MIEFDASELRQIADDFAALPAKAQADLPRIVRKAAVNVKAEWNAAAAGSQHFRIAGTVNFDEKDAFGVYEAEVGPDRARRAARLAGIAHFGGANGGGGTLGDPSRFAENEGPRLESAMSDLIDRVLG